MEPEAVRALCCVFAVHLFPRTVVNSVRGSWGTAKTRILQERWGANAGRTRTARPCAAFSSCPSWLRVPFVIKNTLAALPAVAGQKSALICEICGFLTLAVLPCVPLFSSVPLCVYKTSPDTIAFFPGQ